MLASQLSSSATADEAAEWLRQITRLFGLGFHPDTPAEEYIIRIGDRLSHEDAAALDESLARAFFVLGDERPYEICLVEAHAVLGITPEAWMTGDSLSTTSGWHMVGSIFAPQARRFPLGLAVLFTSSKETAQWTKHKRSLELRIVSVDESEGKREAIPFRSTPAFEAAARFSPDGKWIAYVSNESGKAVVYPSSCPERSSTVQVSHTGGTNPMWSPDGSKIYFNRVAGDSIKNSTITGSAIMVVDLDSAEAFTAPPKPHVLFETQDQFGGTDIAPDGQRFLIVCSPRQTPPIHVVLNALPAKR